MKSIIVVVLLLALLAVCPVHPYAKDAGLSLNLLHPDKEQTDAIRPYMIQMRRVIESQWRPQRGSRALKAKIYFQVLRSGQIINPMVHTTSGDQAFDQAGVEALKAVHAVGQMPPNKDPIFEVIATFDSRFFDPRLAAIPIAVTIPATVPAAPPVQTQPLPRPMESPRTDLQSQQLLTPAAIPMVQPVMPPSGYAPPPPVATPPTFSPL